MKKTIYTLVYAILLVFGFSFRTYAIPAYPGPIQVTQPDGSKLTILLKGDEFLHVAQTTDGYDLKQNAAGYFTYAVHDKLGRLSAGEYVAKDPADRSAKEASYLNAVSKYQPVSATVLNSAIQKRMLSGARNITGLRSTTALRPGLLAEYPTVGSPKSLVILVNFSDTVFKSENTGSAFDNMLNLPGYNANSHVGSVRDYYQYNSKGLFSPEFVVVGPVTVSKPQAYYGGNDSLGNDLRPAQMVYDACVKAAGLVNFSEFDANNDNVVDNVYVFYAGKGEADGGGDNTIWPHSWSLSSARLNLTLNGKKIDAYACSGELNGSTGKMTGMGTFTHEYSHILGLTDMYDVDYDQYNGEAFDLNYWSLMAYGAYNNHSCTPPCLSLPERYFLGWATPTVLNSKQKVTLRDFGSTNQGCLIPTSNSGEYYLLENRQLTKNIWDAYLPHHGMLIYHIDQRKDKQITFNYWGTYLTLSVYELWEYNMVNAIANHQCCDLVEADNDPLLYSGKNATAYLSSIKGDPFPGTNGVDFFADPTLPSMKNWSGEYTNRPLVSITETNGNIEFSMTDYNDSTFIPKNLTTTLVDDYSFRANWQKQSWATGYILDVFQVNPLTGDTAWFDQYHDYALTKNYEVIHGLYKETNYQYRVRATNPFITTLNSPSMNVSTMAATALSAFCTDKTIFLKGVDKVSEITVYQPNGLRRRYSNVNAFEAAQTGLYVIAAKLNGQVKYLKVMVP